MKTKLTLIAITCFLYYSQLSSAQDGESLFKNNCAACHTIGKGKLVGPDLIGVNDRHPEAWALKWIKSSTKMIQSGDAEAVRVFKENNEMPMTDQPLSDPEIKSVLAFIQAKGTLAQTVKTEAEVKPVEPVSTSSVERKTQGPSILNQFSTTEYMLFAILTFLLVVILVLCSTLKLISSAQK